MECLPVFISRISRFLHLNSTDTESVLSLSEVLQSEKILNAGRSADISFVKEMVLAEGNSYFVSHPQETDLIRSNLSAFGLSADTESVNRVIRGVLLHYYEKILPLFLSPAGYRDYLMDRVEGRESMEVFRELRGRGEGTLCTISHFGAVELIAPYIAACGYDLSTVLRFTTQHFSDMAAAHAGAFYSEGSFGKINFIEIGKPGVHAAIEMAAALRRAEIVSTVFDEETEYSLPVTLFGQEISGGAGLHKLITFAGCPMHIINVSMVRNNEENYTFKLDMIDSNKGEPVRQMYRFLEKTVAASPEQWYFLHERIPFIDKAGGR